MYRDGILYVCNAVHIYVCYYEYIYKQINTYNKILLTILQYCLSLNKNQSLFLKLQNISLFALENDYLHH